MTRYSVMLMGLLLWSSPAFAAPGDKIGPSISDELADAGFMGLPFSWRPSDGVVRTDDPGLTEVQRQKIRDVFAAHNPLTLSRAEVRAKTKKTAKERLAVQCQAVAVSPTASPLEHALCEAVSD